MVKLTRSQIRIIEDTVAFPNGRGYVVDFSDRTISEFFEDEFGIDFDDQSITGSGSKRVRLINLLEWADPITAVKVLRALWERREGVVMRTGSRLNANEENAARRMYLKVIADLEVNSDSLKTDAIECYQPDRTLEELVSDIERSLQSNKPEVTMDHLHTYCMKKITHLLEVRGIECSKDEALHARFGKYRKALISERKFTDLTNRTLKMTISLFEAFNNIRNDHSLAHDNTILEHAEARYIFENVSATLRFIRSIEAGRYDS